MRIGSIELDNSIFLAPMAGYTNLPFRILAREFGAGAVFTEMISAKGLHYKDRKTAALMATCPEEAPAGVQIFGSEPVILEEIVRDYINPSPFAFLDFNAGCPAPKIVKNGDGSALMKNPALLGRCVARIKKISAKPVLVKTRIGWDAEHVNIQEVARVIEEAGADALTIHGRTREAFYSGRADWEIIGEVKAQRKIPVILSGDVDSAPAAGEALKRTGCDGLMIGRAAVGNPFIFKAVNTYLATGQVLPEPTPRERIEAALLHMAKVAAICDTPSEATAMRKHLVAYTKGLDHAAELRTRIFKTSTSQEIIDLFQAYWQENGNGPL
jgi:tRNA-dihydrouridine synthase B